MKSKILNYNSSSQSNHATTTNNGTTSSNRGRNNSRSNTNKYSTILGNSKIGKNKDIDKDICNNNNEEIIVESYTLNNNSNSNNNRIIKDSINNNNNNINGKENEKLIEHVLEDLNHLNIESSPSDRSCDCNLNGNSSISNDDDGNHTDRSLEVDNNVDMDDECRKSSGSIPENRTNLIVNYLPQNMSQEEMRMLFSNIGEVESCKLIRDKTTGQSLSYGFVNYQDAKDANTAIQQFNGLRLQNKVIKVSLARPSSETIKGANLYICGLPKSMSQLELEELFSQYGTIITCRILMDSVTGNSKGVAFIRFDQRHEAETAIKKLNGYTPPNGTEPITVKLANTPFNINNSSSSQLSMSHNQNNEYNTTSPNNTTSIPSNNGVRCMMPNIRSIASTGPDIIPRLDMVLQNNGHSSANGMGPEYQQSGPPMPNNHPMSFPTGQMVCPPQMHPIATFPMSYQTIQHPCMQSMPGPQGPTSVQPNSLVPTNGNHPSSQYLSIDHILDSNLCYLIVYNLSPETKEGSLWQTFGPYGAVHSVSLARDPVTGKCRGFGFVTMPNYHEAILAAQHLNGNALDNRILQIVLNPGLKMPTISQYVLPTVAP